MEPLTHAQLNQLLTLAHAAPVSAPFFSYYWLSQPSHPYDLASIPSYRSEWADSLAIFDIEQLYWGLYRFYVDSLLFFGNVRSAYQYLRGLNQKELSAFFLGHMFESGAHSGSWSSSPNSKHRAQRPISHFGDGLQVL